MPNKHGLMDTLKHLAFEEEPEKQGLETAPGAGSKELTRPRPSTSFWSLWRLLRTP